MNWFSSNEVVYNVTNCVIKTTEIKSDITNYYWVWLILGFIIYFLFNIIFNNIPRGNLR